MLNVPKSCGVVIIGAPATLSIVSMNVLESLPAELLAVNVNVNAPDDVGMPEISPVDGSRVRPAGSVPDDTDHVAPETLAASVTV